MEAWGHGEFFGRTVRRLYGRRFARAGARVAANGRRTDVTSRVDKRTSELETFVCLRDW